MSKLTLPPLLRWLGWPATPYPPREQWIAGLGGLVGIIGVLMISRALLGADFVPLIVPSFGATAVLVFAVPHSPLTQPWAVFGGHVLSALVGISCQLLIANPVLAAGAAVGGALLVMHALRCIHPPGGATALSAVIGGSLVHQLGYRYALTPVAINALFIILLGLLYNLAFPWRRYPLALMPRSSPLPIAARGYPQITPKHLHAAMAEQRVVLDVSPQELSSVIEAALRLAASDGPPTGLILCVGSVYSNNQAGPNWAVRRIIDERPSATPAFDLVVYEILDGAGRGRTDSCPRSEFQQWAACELRWGEDLPSPGKVK